MCVVPVPQMLENEEPEGLAALLDVIRDSYSECSEMSWLPNTEVLPFYANGSGNSMLNLCYFMISVFMCNQ